jgi:hypothetical protein
MTRRHQLETTLRTLKLSGMLDTLEARLAQARAGELGHLEFLQVLCEDEINRRDAAALVRRVRHARFEQTVTIEEFDFAYNPNVPAAVIRDLADRIRRSGSVAAIPTRWPAPSGTHTASSAPDRQPPRRSPRTPGSSGTSCTSNVRWRTSDSNRRQSSSLSPITNGLRLDIAPQQARHGRPSDPLTSRTSGCTHVIPRRTTQPRLPRPDRWVGVSDLVTEDRLTEAERAERGSYVGCIAGALSVSEYRAGLQTAGFAEVAVEFTHAVGAGVHAAIVRAVKPATRGLPGHGT